MLLTHSKLFFCLVGGKKSFRDELIPSLISFLAPSVEAAAADEEEEAFVD